MVSEVNEPGSESGKRSDDRRAVPEGTAQEGGASTPLAAPGSFAAAGMRYPDRRLVRRLVLAGALLAAACSALPVPRRASYHASDADLGVTRIAHGAVILELGGRRLVVDPWFHSGFIVRQREPLGLTPDGLPSFAAVLLTHRHGDHFDETALARLAATVATAVARPELHARLVKLGFRQVVDRRRII